MSVMVGLNSVVSNPSFLCAPNAKPDSSSIRPFRAFTTSRVNEGQGGFEPFGIGANPSGQFTPVDYFASSQAGHKDATRDRMVTPKNLDVSVC
jgi:hypothetical protein